MRDKIIKIIDTKGTTDTKETNKTRGTSST